MSVFQLGLLKRVELHHPRHLNAPDLSATFSQNCDAVPRRARISGSYTFVSLNSRLESNDEEEEERLPEWFSTRLAKPKLSISCSEGGKIAPRINPAIWTIDRPRVGWVGKVSRGEEMLYFETDPES